VSHAQPVCLQILTMSVSNIFETPGFSIDIDAVKDQLRILGHDVSDDVVVNFIKEVYLPQRLSHPNSGITPACRPCALV
jgi:hypothetical protein